MSITVSTAVRDPLADHLLTPQNAALAVIDWARAETVEERRQIVFAERLLQK